MQYLHSAIDAVSRLVVVCERNFRGALVTIGMILAIGLCVAVVLLARAG